MRIYVKRQTGFYGQASPIQIRANDQVFSLNHNQEKAVEITSDSVTLTARFFWMKSRPLAVSQLQDGASFVVKMNPQMLLIYVLLFVTVLLVPVILVAPWILLLLLVGYAMFLMTYLKQAYVIEQVD